MMDSQIDTIRTFAIRAIFLIAAAVVVGGQTDSGGPEASDVLPVHALAMHGTPLYDDGFVHFAYANPDAPKGGELSMAVLGSFDSLNPFVVAGRAAAGVREYHFPSLMARSWDEPFSLYGYVAERVELPSHRRWVTFYLNPQARFHDGTPITVDDVVFTIETLREVGLPRFRRNYGLIERVERIGERGIRFRLSEDAERETPMVLGLMPVLSRRYHAEHPLDRADLSVPLGGGPYRIALVEPGRRIVYERVEDWWAADLPALRGQFNFDRIRVDYYRDDDIAIEAFRTGAYNFRREAQAERWATDYDFPAAAAGEVTLLTLPHSRPSGLRGFVFNTRRAPFDDQRVRQALAYAFDFEWANTHLLQGQYRRIQGMFTNSPLAPHGVPDGVELELLTPFRGALPDQVFGPAYRAPSTAAPGGLRRNLRTARQLLQQAGWRVRDGVLVNDETGVPLTFEIVLRQASEERMALAYADTLARLGVQASIRTVDSAQYAERMHRYDFDMTVDFWNVTLSPGAEQDYYWGSRSAGIEGTRNLPGVREPAVDALVDRLENAETYTDLTPAAHALDRVLMWRYYVVPLQFLDRDYVAFWGDLRRVDGVDPLYGTVIEAWWQAP